MMKKLITLVDFCAELVRLLGIVSLGMLIVFALLYLAFHYKALITFATN